MRLDTVSFKSGARSWLYPLDMQLAPGQINPLLGATRSGKTTLLRIMAGLERPTTGRVLDGDRDLTRVPVRERSVAMVYQQFINYPSLSVRENIASPLRVAGRSAAETASVVDELAGLLHLSDLLSRLPGELSGGQQQRVALARALAKGADVLLLDEPLANLDYKLREELREELPRLFARQRTTVVYATTDPQEALQLGGTTHVLVEGRLVQSGPTLQLFHEPATLDVAKAFSDPPLNLIDARIDPARGAMLQTGKVLPLSARALELAASSTGAVTLGLRPHRLALRPGAGTDARFEGRVELAEVGGSETYLHVATDGLSLVAQVAGVHRLALGSPCTLYFDTADLYGFDAAGATLFGPR